MHPFNFLTYICQNLNHNVNLIPLNNYTLVKAISQEKTGVFQVAQSDKPIRGVVISTHEGSKLKQGDTILYARESGVSIDVDGVEHVLLRGTEIYAVISNL